MNDQSQIFARAGASGWPQAEIPKGATVASHSTVAPASKPTKTTLVLKGGSISKISRKPRLKRVPIALSARIVGGLLIVPAVRDEIEFNARLAIVRAASVLIDSGISQNRAADALGVARSRLCVWRQRYAAEGEEALRPAPWNAGRKPAKGRTQRHNAFIKIQTARR